MYFSPVNNLSLHPNNLDVRINQLTFCIPIKEMEGTMHGLFPGISEFSPRCDLFIAISDCFGELYFFLLVIM